MKIKTLSSALLFTALFSASAAANNISGKINSITYSTKTIIVEITTANGENKAFRMETEKTGNPREGNTYKSLSDISTPLELAMEKNYTFMAHTTDNDYANTGYYYVNGFTILKR